MKVVGSEGGPEGRRTRCLAGIDEAGLGPTLGPLVFGVALFRVPSECRDLFAALTGIVARTASALPEKLAIDDSKRLFSGRKDLAPLELAALATLTPDRTMPRSLEEIAGRDSAPSWPRWYGGDPAATVPVACDEGQVAGWRERWPRELAARGIEPLDVRVRPVLEAELNHCFATGLNKAEAVLTRIAPLLRQVADRAAPDDIEIVVDRLGGRWYYSDFLRATFPMRSLTILEERADRSAYSIADGARTIRVSFEVGADGRHLPVALASLCAKYVRELFMRRLNSHFGALDPRLAPTAGYPEDARRWLRDARDLYADAERTALVRER